MPQCHNSPEMGLTISALVLALLITPPLADETARAPKLDPANPSDVQEFLRRGRMTARDLAVEEHGSLKKAAEVYLGKLGSADAEKRGSALSDLIALARDEDLPRIQKAIEEEADATALDLAYPGLRDMVHEKVASTKFRAGLVDSLVKTMPRHVRSPRMRIALLLDPVKPVPAILQHVHLATDARESGEVLRIFFETGARVPAEKLRELAPQLPARNDERAWTAYAIFLGVYALAAPAEAEPLILKALKANPHRKLLDGAEDEMVQALCVARGLHNLYEAIIDRYHAIGFAKLSKAERTYLAVMLLYLAENGAGYAQFLEQYAAEMWNDLRAAMVELKEAQYLKLMDAWSAIFVGKKPGEPGFDFEVAETDFEKKTGKDLSEELDGISKARPFEANLYRAIHFWAADHAAEIKAALGGK